MHQTHYFLAIKKGVAYLFGKVALKKNLGAYIFKKLEPILQVQ
jgi:hypothetical protein